MKLEQIFRTIYKYIKLVAFKNKWRNLNQQNYTKAKNIFPISCVKVGIYTYGDLFINSYSSSQEKLIIGNFCSIAGDTKFLLGGGHDYQNISSYPFKYFMISKETNETITKGPIVIKDDVWIGHGCLILSGVTIGQGAVIGARSIVVKNVPPYAVYAGYEIKKYRFQDNIIKKMMKFDWSKVTKTDILENLDSVYTDPNSNFFNSNFYKEHLK